MLDSPAYASPSARSPVTGDCSLQSLFGRLVRLQHTVVYLEIIDHYADEVFTFKLRWINAIPVFWRVMVKAVTEFVHFLASLRR